MLNLDGKMAIDEWYKVFVLVAAILFGCSLFFPIQGVPQWFAQMGTFGLLLIGIGEMANHPYQVIIQFDDLGRPVGKLHGRRRQWTGIGLLFDLSGAAIIIWALVKIYLL